MMIKYAKEFELFDPALIHRELKLDETSTMISNPKGYRLALNMSRGQILIEITFKLVFLHNSQSSIIWKWYVFN